MDVEGRHRISGQPCRSFFAFDLSIGSQETRRGAVRLPTRLANAPPITHRFPGRGEKPKDLHKPRRNELRFDLRGELYRIFWVDLTQIPGVNALTAYTLLAEVGPDLSRFATPSAFASWLGLCPDNRISGGKVLSVQTRVVKNRVAMALRMASQSLHRSHSFLGDYYRRMQAKLGTPKAITAAAHKLARIIFHLLSTRQAYDESSFGKHEAQHRHRKELGLRNHARKLGFEIIPALVAG